MMNEGDVEEPLDPIRKDVSLVILKMLCLIIGIPLNGIIIWIVLREPEMRTKSRHIFLIGITFSNFVAFVPAILEIVHFFQQSDLLCRCFIFLMGLPDIFLLLNIFLSLLDRYLAIRDPLWHRLHVTVPRVVFWLVVGFAASTLGGKFVFIFQLVELRCEMKLAAVKTLGCILSVLFILCIVARVTVYLQTRKLLLVDHVQETNHMEMVVVHNDHSSPPTWGTIHLNQRTLRRMEIEATRTLVAGVTSLFVLTFPMFVLFVAINICYLLFRNDFYCINCFNFLGNYFKQLGLIHAIYHPIIYLAWNEEFSAFIFRRN